jgi:hypothetical protein
MTTPHCLAASHPAHHLLAGRRYTSPESHCPRERVRPPESNDPTRPTTVTVGPSIQQWRPNWEGRQVVAPAARERSYEDGRRPPIQPEMVLPPRCELTKLCLRRAGCGRSRMSGSGSGPEPDQPQCLLTLRSRPTLHTRLSVPAAVPVPRGHTKAGVSALPPIHHTRFNSVWSTSDRCRSGMHNNGAELRFASTGRRTERSCPCEASQKFAPTHLESVPSRRLTATVVLRRPPVMCAGSHLSAFRVFIGVRASVPGAGC